MKLSFCNPLPGYSSTADSVLNPLPIDWYWILTVSTLKPGQLSRKEHHDQWTFSVKCTVMESLPELSPECQMPITEEVFSLTWESSSLSLFTAKVD